MFIKSIVIEGVEEDVTISRTDDGAEVSIRRFSRGDGAHDRVIAAIGRTEHRESRYAKAVEVAKVVCGRDRHGRPHATNSMVHDVLNEIERVAGC